MRRLFAAMRGTRRIQIELEWPDDQGARRDVEFLTIAEAAKRVRYCERTIKRAIDGGTLRAGHIRGAEGLCGGFCVGPADAARTRAVARRRPGRRRADERTRADLGRVLADLARRRRSRLAPSTLREYERL
nr:hypothetical protein [Pseudoxanthomonas sp.]